MQRRPSQTRPPLHAFADCLMLVDFPVSNHGGRVVTSEAAPTRPEDDGQDDADAADEHQDHSDCADVESVAFDVDRVAHDRAPAIINRLKTIPMIPPFVELDAAVAHRHQQQNYEHDQYERADSDVYIPTSCGCGYGLLRLRMGARYLAL